MSERNAVLHRRILEISGPAIARDICGRLNSQTVRFQFRTVLAPGRRRSRCAEHRAIVDAIAAGERKAAESAMRVTSPRRATTLLGRASGPASPATCSGGSRVRP